jgi:hypothetical protein
LKCRLCSSVILSQFSNAKILGHQVMYFECGICGYVQTEEPTWLDEAYKSPINPSDTGIMARNLSNVELVLATLALMKERHGTVVDYAGGYGFLVRLLRDKGIDAFWADPYSENLVARGFEYTGGGGSLLTAFEAFEHFVNPVQEMNQLVSISPNILLTTSLAPSPTPQPSDWWYYGLDHGQHVGFYRLASLQYLADKFGLNLLSDGVSTHLFTQEKFSMTKWKIFRFLARRCQKTFLFGLESRTWADHLQIAKSNFSKPD